MLIGTIRMRQVRVQYYKVRAALAAQLDCKTGGISERVHLGQEGKFQIGKP